MQPLAAIYRVADVELLGPNVGYGRRLTRRLTPDAYAVPYRDARCEERAYSDTRKAERGLSAGLSTQPAGHRDAPAASCSRSHTATLFQRRRCRREHRLPRTP
jgi:hypothetical protein